MILALRFYGWIMLLVGIGLLLVDLQLSYYRLQISFRTIANLMDTFEIRGTNSYDYGLHSSSALWNWLIDPLVQMPAAFFCLTVATIILAVFRKGAKFMTV